MPNLRRGVVALSCLCLGAGSAQALENLTFTVTGNEDLESALRNASLLVGAESEDVTDTAEILAAARADYGRLIGALYSAGYYGGVIHILVNGQEAADISPLANLETISSVTVQVAPGPLYRFNRAEVSPLAPETELPEGFAVGEPAESGLIQGAAQAAVTGWREVGHAKAEIAGQDVVAQHQSDALGADIAVAPGPMVTFGDLILTGEEQAVREERLRAIAGFPGGEVFSPEELENVATRLRRTQVFSSVALTEAEELRMGDVLDVEADLVAFPPRRIGFGAEFSTVDGVTLSGFWLHRNLLGGAERFRVDGSISGLGGGSGGRDYSLTSRFERPATFSPENIFYIEGELSRLDEENYVSDIASLGTGITRIVNEDLQVSYGIAYRFSSVTDEGGTTDYSLLTLPLGAEFDNRDLPLDAKRGYYVDLDLTPFAGLNEESGTGARLTWDTRSYLSFADERLTLAGRFQGGSISGADLESVPNDYRFYSGGGGTVRGQPYQALGVQLNGIDSGGASFVGLSGEIRGGVTDSIGLVAFYDYGIVGSDAFPGSDSEDHSGAGLGLRYTTPIGPIRLDVARGFGGPERQDEEGGIEVYVGIGQAF